MMVKDINPGPSSASPSALCFHNNVLYFGARTAQSGRELWRTDGSANGTYMLVDLTPGPQGYGPKSFAAIGPKLYFLIGEVDDPNIEAAGGEAAATGAAPGELWVTDGTAANTLLVKTLPSMPRDLTTVGNKLVFSANDGNNGTELWVSDGTAQGTRMLVDIAPGKDPRGIPRGSYPSLFTAVGSKVYFRADTPNYGTELWVTDGTAAGTQLVKDIWPGTAGGYPSHLMAMGTTLYFSASDGTTGGELWKTDGTGSGTVIVKDINAGAGHSSPSLFTPFKGKLYFRARDNNSGTELWVSDGTGAGTTMVKDIRAGVSNSSPGNFAATNNALYFAANDGVHGTEVWKTDGTAAGTVLLKDINTKTATAGSSPFGFTATIIGNVVFRADDGITSDEVWATNGTPAGTKLMMDINPFVPGDTTGSSPTAITDLAGIAYFRAWSAATGYELWKTDGTPAGTVMVKDIHAGTNSSNPANFTLFRGAVYFTADDGAKGTELWKTDGTGMGTVLVKDIHVGSGSASPLYLTPLGGTLYFRAQTSTHGHELWKTDGTANGTVMVQDIWPGKSSNTPTFLTPLGNKLVFRGASAAGGTEIWATDGTNRGAVQLRDIHPGTSSSYPSTSRHPGNGDDRVRDSFLVVGKTLYFTATDNTYGTELWKTDGTPAGTQLVKDIWTGTTSGRINSSSPFYLTAMGGHVYFRAGDGTNGFELWRTDGTAAGTVLVKDIAAGVTHSQPTYLIRLGNRILFYATDSSNDTELWISDGTGKGTVRLQDINPAGNSYPARFTRVGSRHVYFSADDGVHGVELWRTDGTAAGTQLVYDLNPGDNHSSPFYFAVSNGRLLVRADEGRFGTEIYAFALGALSQEVGRGCSVNADHPMLSANDPVFGQNLTVVGQGAAGQNRSALIVGIARAQPVSHLGNDCMLYPDLSLPHVLLFLTPDVQGRWALPQTVPNDTALKGVIVPTQAAFGPSTNGPLGLDLSNGLFLSMGS
jgi:ELWxxDGT repeat protein